MSESQRGSSLTLQCKRNNLSLPLVTVHINNEPCCIINVEKFEHPPLEHPDFNFILLTFLCV